MTDDERMRRLSRRGLLWSGAALLGGYGALKAMAAPHDAAIPPLLRRVLDANAEIVDSILPARLAPRFPLSSITALRTNGDLGLSTDFDPGKWLLRVEGLEGEAASREFSLGQIQALPRVEMTTELCCIEGWSMVVRWAGARFRDFVGAHPVAPSPNGSPPRYVAFETPDGNYFVGLDLASALHPDTLLCYEMNELPLTLSHGAPLRLVVPIKYGLKSIKRVGTIRFSDERPRDAWAEAGYDWDAGL